MQAPQCRHIDPEAFGTMTIRSVHVQGTPGEIDALIEELEKRHAATLRYEVALGARPEVATLSILPAYLRAFAEDKEFLRLVERLVV